MLLPQDRQPLEGTERASLHRQIAKAPLAALLPQQPRHVPAAQKAPAFGDRPHSRAPPPLPASAFNELPDR